MKNSSPPLGTTIVFEDDSDGLEKYGIVKEPLRRCPISLQRSSRGRISDVSVRNLPKSRLPGRLIVLRRPCLRPSETLRPLRGQPVAVLV